VLPSTLERAVGAFRTDTRLREKLGEGFSEYFARTREWELHAWQRAVTEWERERYGQI
jgi:glutamine synthetase